MTVHLDSRLEACAGLVRLESRIADIGTDHGLLPCRLYQLGARGLYASDVREGPLSAAKATLDLYGIPEGEITLLLSDGLEKVPPVDDIVIAGMGGELIGDIIEKCPFLHKGLRFILQPMTRDFMLRRKICRLGLEILKEVTAVAHGKVYTVILAEFTGEKREVDDIFAFMGKNTDEVYRRRQLATLRKMGRGDGSYLSLAEQIDKICQKGEKV